MVVLGGGAVSYERGTPVQTETEAPSRRLLLASTAAERLSLSLDPRRLGSLSSLGFKRCRHSSAAERRANNFNGFQDVRTENGSSQGHNLALTCLFVPSSLDSGPRNPFTVQFNKSILSDQQRGGGMPCAWLGRRLCFLSLRVMRS